MCITLPIKKNHKAKRKLILTKYWWSWCWQKWPFCPSIPICLAYLLWLVGILDPHSGALDSQYPPPASFVLTTHFRQTPLASISGTSLGHGAVNALWLAGAQLAGARQLLVRPARSLDSMYLAADTA